MDSQSLRQAALRSEQRRAEEESPKHKHLHALRSFIRSLVEQAERSEGCDCHRPPSLLLVGPPGAGKTYLVKQMSTVCEMPLFGVHAHNLRSAQGLSALFHQAREIDYPSLVFLDDVDRIFNDHDLDPGCDQLAQQLREELFAQLGPRKLRICDPNSTKNPTKLPLSAGSSRCSSRASSPTKRRLSAPPDKGYDEEDPSYPDNNGLILVAATSNPWLLYKDHELLSRFRGVYLVGLPDKQARFAMLTSLMQEIQHNLTDKELMLVAEKTEGFTPSDLLVMVKTLSYKQFSFLFSMAAERGSEGSSDADYLDSQTPISSETSETGSDSDMERISVPARVANKMGNPRPYQKHEEPKRNTHLAATSFVPPLATSGVQNPRGREGSKCDPLMDTSKKRTPLDTGPPNDSPAKYTKGLPCASSGVPLSQKNLTVTSLGGDWNSDSDDDVHGELSNGNCKPTRVLEDSIVGAPHQSKSACTRDQEYNVPSPDSAICLSKSSEEDFDSPKTCKALDEPDSIGMISSDSGHSSCGGPSSVCDSSDSCAVSETNSCRNGMKSSGTGGVTAGESETNSVVYTKLGYEASNGVGDSVNSRCHSRTDTNDDADDCGDDGPMSEKEVTEMSVSNSSRKLPGSPENDKIVGKIKEFELYYTEPRDATPNDNNAGDCDSDVALNETSRPRSRRVAFSGMPAMEPLSVDVGGHDGPPPLNVPLDEAPPDITVGTVAMSGPVHASDRIQNDSANAILRNLLSHPSSNPRCGSLNGDVDEGLDGMHLSNSLGPHMPALDTDRPNNLKGSLSRERSTTLNNLNSSTCLHNNNDDLTGCNRIENNTNGEDGSDIHGFLLVRNLSAKSKGTSTPEPNENHLPYLSTTPTPSETSSKEGTVGSSASGDQASSASSTTDNQNKHQKQDSDSSFATSEDQPHISSDVSTETCNETRETMECRTDSEERLGDLEERQVSGRTSDEDASNAKESKELEVLQNILNLDDPGEISIKVITLADVLDIVKRAYRTVTDEEIRKYTDFMVWFANVAKSACPHNTSSKPNAPSYDDVSLASTSLGSPSMSKRRKGPLRKLGRFLLKALMFILD